MSKHEDYKVAQDEYGKECPLIYALNIIGKKWKLPIIWHLLEHDVMRYNELKRSVRGITNIMLTKSLQELEEQQLICRKQYDTVPPKVEYSLTAQGKSMLPMLSELFEWGEKQMLFNEKMED